MEEWKDALRKLDVDVDGSIARFSGKEERYVKYLRLFSEDESFDGLLDALAAGEVEQAFDYCHTLKGLVNNLGFEKMMPVIYDACEILRAGRTEGVLQLLNEVSDNYTDIINAINNLL